MPLKTMIYTTSIATMRGMTRARIFTAGARAKARIAAMASKMSERPTCDAAHRITATTPIQASVASGMPTRRIHLALVRMSMRHVSEERLASAASPVRADDDEREIVLSGSPLCKALPHFGQNVEFSGQFVPQCIQYMDRFLLFPNILCCANSE